MSKCTECELDMGFLNARVAYEAGLDSYRNRGFNIPRGLCQDCAGKYIDKINVGLGEKSPPLEQQIPDIPVATLQALCPSDIEIVGIVSAHVALGTGPLSQMLSSITDLFGAQSETYSKKMIEAEEACLAKLKIRAGEMGADAVIGMQATYTELTSGHGMLLVCMAGTAVKKIAGHATQPAP